MAWSFARFGVPCSCVALVACFGESSVQEDPETTPRVDPAPTAAAPSPSSPSAHASPARRAGAFVPEYDRVFGAVAPEQAEICALGMPNAVRV